MEIVENDIQYSDQFIQLNELWISTYFKIEEADRKLAANPNKIIDEGGYLFCLVLQQEVIGTCALINQKNAVYELARMTVAPEHRGKHYGQRLIQACLSKLKEIKAKEVYLLSNTKLKAAINLYKKYMFQTVYEGPHPTYSRANIIMKRNI